MRSPIAHPTSGFGSALRRRSAVVFSGSVSTPIVPGYIERPGPTSLLDLWPRPAGEYPDELWPEDVLRSVVNEPTGWLTVCEHYFTPDGHGGRGCVLAPPEDAHAVLSGGTGWVGHGLGTFSIWEGPDGETGFDTGLTDVERDADLQFFVQVKRPEGSPDPLLDIWQPFLWYFDAYPVRGGWAYVNEAGRPQELVKSQIGREHWIIQVRALEFRQFLHACGRDAIVQIDCVPLTKADGFPRTDDEFACEWANFDFVATSERAVSEGGFSRLLGQYVVKGNRTSRVPRFEERRSTVEYPQFVYGVDPASGEPLRHTCDPDQLGTYFDDDNSRLHYLTTVNFKREVLIPYAQEPRRYRLRRSRLECLGLWGLDISFNTAGLVEVYLGDLGRDLPSDDWGHWLTYNVIPEGQMEEGRFRRDFLAQFASSPDIPTELRRARDAAAASTERLFGVPLWRSLGDEIAPEYESMIGPLSDDPVALQAPLILLAKCFVDAIDPVPLKTYLGDAQSGERSLSLLGRFAERLGGSQDDVEGLRALYDVRSAGGFAHLAGARRDAALERLGIKDLDTIDAFDHVAARIIECLQRITELTDSEVAR